MRPDRATGWAALVAVAAVAACGPTSVQGDHSERPSPRTDASAAFDPENGTVVMFGGATRSGALDETWTWDGHAWRQQHPPDSPPAREAAAMAFDPARRHVIAFGGVSCPPPQPNDMIGCEYQTSPTSLRDTWSWDGTNWSRVNTLHTPFDQFQKDIGFAAGTDELHRRLILVGYGQPDPDHTLQTWTLQSGDWIRLQSEHSPPAMEFGGPAFDAVSSRLMLHQNGAPHVTCGTGQSCVQLPEYPTTWSWDGSDWLQLSGSVGSPGDYGQLVPAGSSGMVLIGIWNMYRWTGKSWTGPNALPWRDIIRMGWAAAYDQATHQLVLFGGRAWQTNHLYGDTLSWDGRAWRTLLAAQPSPNSGRLAACSAKAAETGLGWGNVEGQPGAIAYDFEFAEPPSGPCHLGVDMRFTLTSPSGAVLPIRGNPSTVHLNRDLTFDAHTQLVKFTITNACALDPNTVESFSAGDYQHSHTVTLPTCTSQSAAPVTISATVLTGPP